VAHNLTKNLTKFCSRSWPWKSRPISESSRPSSLLPMGFNLLEQHVSFWVYLVAMPPASHRTSHAQCTYPRFGSSATARGSSPTSNGLGRRASQFGIGSVLKNALLGIDALAEIIRTALPKEGRSCSQSLTSDDERQNRADSTALHLWAGKKWRHSDCEAQSNTEAETATVYMNPELRR
jgi:hypothetical protein